MKKFSKKLIWYRLVVNIFLSLLFGFVTFSSFLPDEGESVEPDTLRLALIVAFVAVIVSYIILAIYQIFYYKCSGYELKEKEIVCVKGVLFKKKSILEYKKINAINSKQNLIEKIFSISKLQVDSGSTNTAHTAEIQIIEEDSIVKDLMKVLKSKQNNEIVYQEPSINELEESNNISKETDESIYDFNSKRKAIYTALQIAWVIVGGIIALFFGLIVMTILVFLKELDLPALLIIFGASLAILIVVSLIGFVFGLIGSLIAYYDFKLIRNKNDIEISYGLFTKISNTFKYNKIKAIRINQSIIQKLFGFVTIKVEVVGYTVQSGDENKAYTTGMLIPLCKKSEVNKLLDNILPDYVPLEKKNKAKKYFPFISYHLLFSFIVFVLVQIILIVFLTYYDYTNELIITSGVLSGVYIVYIVILMLERKLAQFNSGFSLKNGKLCIFRGSLVEETIIMKKQNITGIDAKTTYFRKKHNIYTYKIHFRSNAETNTVTILNVDKTEGNEIYDLVKF